MVTLRDLKVGDTAIVATTEGEVLESTFIEAVDVVEETAGFKGPGPSLEK